MKRFYTSIALSLTILIQPVQADLISDSEQIMNDGQLAFNELFPTNQITQIFDPYRYRFYPSTGIYLGINQDDSGVYVLGGPFGETPVFVDHTDNVIDLLNSQLGGNGNNSQNTVCNTNDIPDGFVYRQEGNTTFVTTNGQCIELPENRTICDIPAETNTNNQAIETGIHVLTQSTVSSFEVMGISIPGFDSIIQEAANQKTCIIHAPTGFVNHTVQTDICVDITNQLGEFSSLEGITPPVTTRFTGTTNITIVDDCFNTDADTIFNLVTEEFQLN